MITDAPKADWRLRVASYLIDAAAAAVLGYASYLMSGKNSLGWLVFELVFLVNFILGWKSGGRRLECM